MAQVTEETQGRLNDVWRRLITDPLLDLRGAIAQGRVRDENTFISWCKDNNVDTSESLEAYRMVVKGEYGTYEQPHEDAPEYRRHRQRWEYALQHALRGHEYGEEAIEKDADDWASAMQKSINRKKKGSNEKTLADVKSYSEFRELRERNPDIPANLWLKRQHYNVYRWQRLSAKYAREEVATQTDSDAAKDYTKIGIHQLKTQDEVAEWIKANKATDVPDNVLELRNDYHRYQRTNEWDRLARAYGKRNAPLFMRGKEKEDWENNPLNMGLEAIKTVAGLQAIVDDMNKNVLEEDKKLQLQDLLLNKQIAEDWHNPELAFNRQDILPDVKKGNDTLVEAPVVEPSGVPEMRTSDYTPPPAAPFNYPYGTVGDPSEDLFYSPDEEDEAQEGEAGDPGTQAPVLERSSIPPFYDSSPSDDDETEEEDRSGAPSGRPSIRQIRNLTKLLRGGGTAATGAGGVGAAGAGTAGAASGGLAATTGAGTAVAVGGTAGGATVGFALVILGLVLLVILIIVLVVMFFGGASNNGEVSLSFTKSGPAAVANNEEIAYTLSANYPGEADDIVISDTLSEDVEIIDEKTSKPYTYNSASRRISWSAKQLASGSASTSAATTATVGAVDISKYTKSPFSLPSPNAESDRGYTSSTMQNLNELGSFITKHQSYLVTKAKNNNPVYVDPFVSVIWVGAIEGTEGNQFSWNCRDDRNIRINDGCSGGFASGRWQVGYGLQVAQAVSHIEGDFNEVYGANSANNAQQVASVGQKVIDQSASSPAGQITNPRFFPTETVSSLIIKARAGDIAAQQAIAVLLMDKELGAVSIAQEIAGDIAGQDNWRATMEGWSSYYSTNMQNFANRMKKISEQYSGGTGGTSTYVGSRTVTLTVRPKKENTYVINISNAQVLGARGKPGQSTGAGTAPNAENCQGKYVLNSSIAKNFGDPNCNFTPDGLANILREQDSANAELWYQIARCESGHNPNAWRDPNKEPKTPDPAGAWGLFQMGSAINGPGTFGNGRNGVYDRGDVEWPLQTSNALNYYKTILKPRGASIGAYWECAQ